MKKKSWLRLLLCAALLAGLEVFFLHPVGKIGITYYVRRNSQELSQYVYELSQMDGGDISGDGYNGWSTKRFPNTGMVQFETGGFGIVPSSTYWGFYYSPEDEPLGFDGTDADFEKDGRGWLWQQSDNRNYTERIAENWYWFSMSF